MHGVGMQGVGLGGHAGTHAHGTRASRQEVGLAHAAAQAVHLVQHIQQIGVRLLGVGKHNAPVVGHKGKVGRAGGQRVVVHQHVARLLYAAPQHAHVLAQLVPAVGAVASPAHALGQVEKADLQVFGLKQQLEAVAAPLELLHKERAVAEARVHALAKPVRAVHLPAQPELERVLAAPAVERLVPQVVRLGVVGVEEVVRVGRVCLLEQVGLLQQDDGALLVDAHELVEAPRDGVRSVAPLHEVLPLLREEDAAAPRGIDVHPQTFIPAHIRNALDVVVHAQHGGAACNIDKKRREAFLACLGHLPTQRLGCHLASCVHGHIAAAIVAKTHHPSRPLQSVVGVGRGERDKVRRVPGLARLRKLLLAGTQHAHEVADGTAGCKNAVPAGEAHHAQQLVDQLDLHEGVHRCNLVGVR
mmetsp:Transcript_2060/g.4789  ORF Transcript_2060/g.4789 Transcript_2060/m.4789 type:complete len:415 (+) Transcript_2060:68-1312(+)